VLGRQHTGSSDRGWGLAVALLAGAQAAFILYSRRHDWFFLDDFLDFIVAHIAGLNWSLLGHDLFGQFSPGYRLVDWLFVDVTGLHYTIVRLFDIGCIAGATLMLAIIARAWRVALPVALPVLAFVAFSPIFQTTYQWFASALLVLPGMVFGTAIIACMAVRGPVGCRRRAAGAVLYMLGLCFYAKLLFLPVLLAGARLFCARDQGLEFPAALRRLAWDLGLFVPVALIYAAIVVGGHYTSGVPPHSVMPVLRFIGIGFAQGLAANLFGFDPASAPLRLLAMALILLPVAASIAINRFTAWLWAGFAASFVLGMAAVAWGRVVMFGPDIAAIARYHAETAVFYLACVLIAVGVCGARFSLRLPVQPLALSAILSGALACALMGAALRVPLVCAEDDGRIRAYVTAFSASLQAAGSAAVKDDALPDWVMPAWMFPLNRQRLLAGILGSPARFADQGLVIDGQGRLVGR